MDPKDIYVSVSLTVDDWCHLFALLSYEKTNSVDALISARENKDDYLISFYESRLNFLSVCIDEILVSLHYGNKDL